MIATETPTQTAEQKRDALAEAVFAADQAWYADIENAELKAAYKAAKAAFREFENDALARGISETCTRCGGEGGWKGWPGFTCFKCGGCGKQPMTKTRFQAAPSTRLKKEAAAEAEMAENDRVFRDALATLDIGDALLAAYDKQRASTDYDDLTREEHFRADIAFKLWKYGSLSAAQIDAVRKGLARDAEKAADEARTAAADPLPEGTYEITGEILTTRFQESQYGGSLKMLVKLDSGNKVWGSVPKALGDPERGTRIAFTATVERSPDDEHFGFFKRPKDAKTA